MALCSKHLLILRDFVFSYLCPTENANSLDEFDAYDFVEKEKSVENRVVGTYCNRLKMIFAQEFCISPASYNL